MLFDPGTFSSFDDVKGVDAIVVRTRRDAGEGMPGAREGGTDPRACPTCTNEQRTGGRLGLRLGRTGAFIGCSNYPNCKYTRQLGAPEGEGALRERWMAWDRLLRLAEEQAAGEDE